MTLEWARPDLNLGFVHVRRYGQELQLSKHPSYVGRTSLFIDKLKHGDISLKLSKVKLSDEGKYRCFLPSLDRESIVELVVGAVSSPVVGITKNSSEVVLGCESKGWYPEPEVFWLDGEGNILSAGPTETARGPDGLYTVSSRVTVEKTDTNRFTCRVQQQNINQTRETHIHVPDHFFVVAFPAAVYITIVLAVVFMCIVAVVFVVWRWRRNKIKTKKNHEDETEQRREKKTRSINNDTEIELEFLMEGERDRTQLMAEKKAKIDMKKKNLQKKENKWKHTKGLDPRRMEQKKELLNQRQQLKLLLKEAERQMDENERKLQSVSREVTEREREETGLKIQQEAAERENQELRQETELQAEQQQKVKPLEVQEEIRKQEQSQNTRGAGGEQVASQKANVEQGEHHEAAGEQDKNQEATGKQGESNEATGE
ncbi:butyrophilin subfamily 3 member A2-like [Centroberyx affinis]|uniref:butyrophilin subfamily 3 member A2-like n=1 Tax=Centroberyx affinis TaxID=166261 RepID=UPI003A5C66FD